MQQGSAVYLSRRSILFFTLLTALTVSIASRTVGTLIVSSMLSDPDRMRNAGRTKLQSSHDYRCDHSIGHNSDRINIVLLCRS